MTRNNYRFGRKVFIAVPDLFVHDATADLVRAQAAMLESQGHQVSILAQRTYRTELCTVQHPQDLTCVQARNSDLIVHYGIFDSCLQDLLLLPFNSTTLYFHNITPPHLATSQEVSEVLHRSWAQFLEISPHFNRRIGNSPFTISQAKSKYVNKLSDKLNHLPWAWLPPRITSISRDMRVNLLTPKLSTCLCMIGRIADFKNTIVSLRLFNELWKLNNEYQLYIIGRDAGIDKPSFYVEFMELVNTTPNVTYIDSVNDRHRNAIVAKSIASLNLSSHEGFCLPVYESSIQSTLSFYGSSQWLSQYLDCKELQVGISGDLEFDAYKIDRILQNSRHYKRLMRHVVKRSAMVEKLCSFRHQYQCLTQISVKYIES